MKGVDFVPSSGALRAVVRLPSSLDPPVIRYVCVGVEAFVPSCNATLRGLPDQNNGRRPSATG